MCEVISSPKHCTVLTLFRCWPNLHDKALQGDLLSIKNYKTIVHAKIGLQFDLGGVTCFSWGQAYKVSIWICLANSGVRLVCPRKLNIYFVWDVFPRHQHISTNGRSTFWHSSQRDQKIPWLAQHMWLYYSQGNRQSWSHPLIRSQLCWNSYPYYQTAWSSIYKKKNKSNLLDNHKGLSLWVVTYYSSSRLPVPAP